MQVGNKLQRKAERLRISEAPISSAFPELGVSAPVLNVLALVNTNSGYLILPF